MITHITKLDKDASYVIQMKNPTDDESNTVAEIFKKLGINIIIIPYIDKPIKIDKK